MSDIALIWDGAQSPDLALEDNDLMRDDGLETAVMLSLFLDRQAEETDILPDGEPDRRGWWADAYPVSDGDKIGSRLWLLSRSKDTQDVRTRAAQYAREALQWLIDDKVASQIDIAIDVPRPGVLAVYATIYRPALDPANYQFNYTWAAQEARR